MTELTIEQMDEMIVVYLQYVFLAGWRALPVLLVALAIGFCFRRALAPRYHALLWTLVVLRLLTPVSVVNPWSIHGPIDQIALKLFEEDSAAQNPIIPQQEFVFLGSSASSTQTAESAEIVSIDNLIIHSQPSTAPLSQEHSIDWEEAIARIIVYTIVGGAVVLILRSSVAHIRFSGKLDRCSIIDDPNVILSVHHECLSLGISRLPLLKEVPDLSTPAVFGLFRGTICLPAGLAQSLTANELRWVIRHELAHISRKDTWLMTIASLANSLHWFNPIAILATAKIRSYLETAADQIAIGSTATSDAAAYGRLLIRIAEQLQARRPTTALGLLPFASARHLKRRIVSLSQSHRPRREWVNWFAMLVVIGCTTFILTDASASVDESDQPKPSRTWKMPTQFAVRGDFFNESTDSSQITTHQFEIGQVLQKIDETWPNDGDPGVELLGWCKHFYPTSSLQLDGNTLAAEFTKSQAKSMRRMLDAWASTGPQQISIEFRIIKTDLRYASTINWLQQRIENIDHHGPMFAAKISDGEMKALSHVMYSDKRTEVLNAPKVTIFNGRMVLIDSTYKRRFVTAATYERDPNTKKALSMDPLVEEKEIGMKAEFMPIVISNNLIQFTFNLQNAIINQVAMATLPGPYSSFDEVGHPETGFTVEVPSISIASVSSTVDITSTETILIAAPDLYQEENSPASRTVTLYVITPRIIDLNQVAN